MITTVSTSNDHSVQQHNKNQEKQVPKHVIYSTGTEKQRFGSGFAGSGSDLYCECGIRIRIKIFDDQKFKKLQLKKFLEEKKQHFYSQASVKGFQATGEASNPQTRTSNISKHEISSPFFCFCKLFCLQAFWPNPDP